MCGKLHHAYFGKYGHEKNVQKRNESFLREERSMRQVKRKKKAPERLYLRLSFS